MEILHRPCEPKEAIYFDQGNLTRFLDYLDQSQYKSLSDINQIKIRIRVLDVFEQQIKDLNSKIELQKIRIENNESSISNHNQKLIDLEAKGQINLELIKKNEESIINLNQNIKSIDEKIININNKINDNTISINVLKENFNNLKSISDEHTITIEKHDINFNKLITEFFKIPELEGSLNIHRNKTKEKFKKNKRRLLNYVNQVTGNLNAMENYLKITNLDSRITDKPFEFPALKLNDFDLNSNSFPNIENNPTNNKKEIFEQMKSLKKTVDLHEQQINSIMNNNSMAKLNKPDLNLNNQLDENSGVEIEKQFKELERKFFELESFNKFLLRHLEGKVSKDELDSSNKQLFIQFERMDQRNRRKSKVGNDNSNGSNKGLDIEFLISPEWKELIKKLISDSIKGNDIIEKLVINQHNTEEDIKKINDNVKGIQNQLNTNTEQLKVIPKIQSKLIEIEAVIKDINRSMIELNSRDMIEEVRLRTDSNIPAFSPRMVTVREYIKSLVKYIKENQENIETVNNKMENINQEIIQKVKKDLSNESSKLIEEFRNDLKCSITRVQEQLKEKVDKFNLDEFSKRLDMKIINEVSKKLDRSDLNKNTTVINKKIDTLENKISKTLVDALIDLQLEEAPLIMKRSLQGSDKCGSCNQHLPFSSSNNLLNQYSHLNNNFQQQEKSDKITNLGTTQNIKRSLHKVALESSDENNPSGKNRLHASSVNFNLPELGHSSSFSKSLNKFNKSASKENSDKPSKLRKVNASSQLNLSQPLMNYDEFSEKQLNSMINSELEKKIINPDNIIRATKRVYENIDKKYKEK